MKNRGPISVPSRFSGWPGHTIHFGDRVTPCWFVKGFNEEKQMGFLLGLSPQVSKAT